MKLFYLSYPFLYVGGFSVLAGFIRLLLFYFAFYLTLWLEKKIDLSNSSVSRRDTYHWIGCHLNSGLEMIVAFVVLSSCYIVSVLMIGSLQQTIERWQNLKGQELSIAAKCFVTFTFGPPDISMKTEFRPWSNLKTRLFESSSLHWKKKSKDKNNKKTKNKTDVNPYCIFWSQWQFILFLS